MAGFDGAELHKLATRIVANEANEAGFRTGVNRAYYACYLVGAEATAKKGWFTATSSAADHGGLRRALRDHARPLDSKLGELYRMREHVDYHTSHSLADSECNDCKVVLGGDTTHQKTWDKAKAIADDILPRLQSIGNVATK